LNEKFQRSEWNEEVRVLDQTFSETQEKFLREGEI